jgi:hypothetical protein
MSLFDEEIEAPFRFLRAYESIHPPICKTMISRNVLVLALSRFLVSSWFAKHDDPIFDQRRREV